MIPELVGYVYKSLTSNHPNNSIIVIGMDSSKKNVIKYYNETSFDYKLIFFRKNDFSMNYGYRDRNVKKRIEGSSRLYEIISQKIDINKNHNILDAGCGFGEASIWMANNIGCKVTGISLVENQIEKARKHAKEKNVPDKTKFIMADYTKTNFPDNSFDRIIAIETICHLEDKTDFYKEAYRILKPGGKILVAEYCLIRDSKTPKEKNELDLFYEGWSLPNLWNFKKHKQIMEKQKFKNVKTDNYSKHTDATAKFIYRYSIFGIPLYRALRIIGIVNSSQLRDTYSCKYQWITKEAGLWGHYFLSGEK